MLKLLFDKNLNLSTNDEFESEISLVFKKRKKIAVERLKHIQIRRIINAQV